ncbi:MAG: homoserine dehydrogenase [Gammaproteobacteria bacterium]|nr:homoserine dehydrogenase [Gammaproteobacteria bacterium]
MKPVKVGLLGLGTVGGGTVNVLKRNGKEIARRAGRGIEIAHACARELSKARICDTRGITLSVNAQEVVDNPEIEIVVELMGGTHLAREMILRAIQNGKHVVTANKALIAKHGNEIFAAATKRGVMVAFEAAVAGGIPIIKAIREGLSGNHIQWVAGIINGTSNFILTELRDDVLSSMGVAGSKKPGTAAGKDFATVLKEAQRLGYAEADPTFDIEGIDAGHKLTILASIAFGIPLQFDAMYTEGISKITRDDVAYAEELGYRIKLLGITKRLEQGIELRVHPTMIPARRLIANVDGVMNAVLVSGDAVGPTLYYGAGAGAEPTASAVVADLVDVVRALTSDPENRVPHLAFQADALSDVAILPISEVMTAYYLRLQALDKPGVLADVTRILADQQISIEAIIQKEPSPSMQSVSVIILTHQVKEQRMNEAIKRIEALQSIRAAVTRIRVESLGK